MKAVRRCVARSAVAIGVVVLGLTVYPSNRLTAQSRLWSPEERVLVTDFSVVTAVAASPFTVFAATPRGLLSYDRIARRWRLPVTQLEGYPASPVRAALADVAGDAVWLGLADGYARYDAGTHRWEGASFGAAVSAFVMDADNPAQGVWARTARGWIPLSRFGVRAFGGAPLPARQVRSLSVEDALARAPMADAMRALILTDARLRHHRFTAAAVSPDQSDVFLGTDGIGVVRLDPRTAEWETLSYGLPGPRAGALATGPGGVWVATGRDGGPGAEPGGVTWVAEDLTTMDAGLGRTGATVGGTVTDPRALLASGSALWLASDGGLDRLDPGSLVGRRSLGDEVFALAPAPGGVWAGVRRGAVRVTDEETVWVSGPAVLALRRLADSLWLGTSAGLAVLPLAAEPTALVPLAVGRGAPGLAGPVIALSQAGDTLIAASPDELAWRDPAGGAWTVVRPAVPLGRITCLALDADGVWVGGTAGLAHWVPATGRFVALRVPGDLPAAVRDVAVGGRYVWVATDGGLVRLERAAVLGR